MRIAIWSDHAGFRYKRPARPAIRIARSEAIGYQIRRREEHRQYWQEAEGNLQQLAAQIEKAGEAIRKRLSRVGGA